MKESKMKNLMILLVSTILSNPVYAFNWGAAMEGLGKGISDSASRQIELDNQKELIRHQHELEMKRMRQQMEIENQRQQQELLLERERMEAEYQRKLAEEELNKKEAEETKRNATNTGTGFFISSDGYVVTNHHVVEDKSDYLVRDRTGDFKQAKLIAVDSSRDIAILKVEGEFPWLRIGDSNAVSKGQRVLAVGYPQIQFQGSESKVTDGVVSSFSGIRNDPNWFQISVPIQGGNSGGPLVNESGDVLGIVVATANAARFFKETGSMPQNINYAIKSNVLSAFLKERGIKNSPTAKTKVSIDYVDNATVLILASNGPIDVGGKNGSLIGGADAKKEAAAEKLRVAEEAKQAKKEANTTIKKAKAGDVNAQNTLGLMYETGKGVPKDAYKAAAWYQKAAERGDAYGQFSLGRLYLNGNGDLKQDFTKAHKWIEKAAEQGLDVAQYSLGITYLYDNSVPRDAVKAVKWLQKAAVQGLPDAQGVLSGMYINGDGVKQDNVLAFAWASLGASSQNEFSLGMLKHFEALTSSTEKEEAQRLSSSWRKGQLLVREEAKSQKTETSSEDKTEGERKLTAVHPDWRSLIISKQFEYWKDNVITNKKELMESNDVDFIAQQLTQFKEWRLLNGDLKF